MSEFVSCFFERNQVLSNFKLHRLKSPRAAAATCGVSTRTGSSLIRALLGGRFSYDKKHEGREQQTFLLLLTCIDVT
ncbi:hypothetical protein B6A27_12685 [Anoxybacillus sp. UARK-01]|uniref:hypothetical protein n=1 Tax=Anoxybacillus sp. UARK-01 TaxID=1895648 RepID=UPI0009B9D6AB|nr:hypothetical protein [Anoxybacillus sp. UARK-01]OQM44899.1 hypothetical protein B6A27_12685 [Anoxybacillus sp. UARK-01]